MNDFGTDQLRARRGKALDGEAMPENARRKQRGQFQKGQSGNPTGKPKGARHRATLAAEALLDGEAKALTRKAIERAKQGDSVALRLCLERILPPRKDRVVQIDLPRIKSVADAIEALSHITRGVSSGDLTPTQGLELGTLITSTVKSLETHDLEKRIQELEKSALEKDDAK